MGRKKMFSLIEIAVAMAVAAVGVAAIMALLPVAVKSTSDSVGDTLAADAANTVFAQLDTFSWVGSDDTDGKDIFDAIWSLPTKKPTSKQEGIMNLAEGKNLFSNQSYEFLPVSGENGHWLLLFGKSKNTSSGSSGVDTEGGNDNSAPDFAAEVMCWRDPGDNLYLSYLESGKSKPSRFLLKNHPSTNTTKPTLVRVYVEISWPATKPYDKNKIYSRQSRMFVREYLNPAYSPPKVED